MIGTWGLHQVLAMQQGKRTQTSLTEGAVVYFICLLLRCSKRSELDSVAWGHSWESSLGLLQDELMYAEISSPQTGEPFAFISAHLVGLLANDDVRLTLRLCEVCPFCYMCTLACLEARPDGEKRVSCYGYQCIHVGLEKKSLRCTSWKCDLNEKIALAVSRFALQCGIQWAGLYYDRITCNTVNITCTILALAWLL